MIIYIHSHPSRHDRVTVALTYQEKNNQVIIDYAYVTCYSREDIYRRKKGNMLSRAKLEHGDYNTIIFDTPRFTRSMLKAILTLAEFNQSLNYKSLTHRRPR